ncbi:M55 family metallopeptidase [Nonomuraea candida]|uniref:M55 family metallopeptidase n=1 Tax=Nonomuraea candida TaxID=359159 RepID=UPI0005B8FBF1|nr:M55 family metallopeptidase [Nonomuraea candida]
MTVAALKVLVSVDMEGIASIVHPAETTPAGGDYARGRALMTEAANAVVAGVLEAESAAEVLVADSHGPYRNLLPEDLDRRARLIRGKPRELGMLAGLQAGAQVVMFVGYHARAGAAGAVLAHTMADAILDVRINGRSHGEIGINTLLAGSYGAPVVLASGDEAACAEFTALVPGGLTVPVKRGLGQHAADTLHPREACDRLRQAAGQAIRRHDEHRPVAASGPLEVEVDLYQPRTADLAALIPGIARTGRAVRFTAENMTAAYGLLQLLALLTSMGP